MQKTYHLTTLIATDVYNQVASSTLDASAKIYAGRVDAIHTETYKVLTGLGRSNERRDADSGDGEEAGDLQEGDPKDPKNKRVRARRKKATVEANLKNINVKKFDMEFEVWREAAFV